MEPSLNGRIMWADIKGKVNDVNVKSSCLGVSLDVFLKRYAFEGIFLLPKKDMT